VAKFTKGHTKAGGRKAGVPNKSTVDIKLIAREMTPAATERLAQLLKSDNEAVALGAVKEVYDRAYGKATQIVAGDEEAPLRIVTRIELVGGG
jgi:hypothetical protein